MRSTGRHPPRPALPVVAAFVALLAAEPSFAFRCGGKLVSEGDHISKVLRFCGEPVGRQERLIYREGFTRPRFRTPGPAGWIREREVVSYDRSVVEVIVEEWTYNFGPHRLMQLVRFENGFVTDVTPLSYGYH